MYSLHCKGYLYKWLCPPKSPCYMYKCIPSPLCVSLVCVCVYSPAQNSSIAHRAERQFSADWIALQGLYPHMLMVHRSMANPPVIHPGCASACNASHSLWQRDWFYRSTLPVIDRDRKGSFIQAGTRWCCNAAHQGFSRDSVQQDGHNQKKKK